ncbi:MAG: hypothetical protein ACJ74Q_15425 [Pyrinomonadaceae bacterium]
MDPTTATDADDPLALAEAAEEFADQLFNRIYELAEAEPYSSPRRIMLDDAAGRAVRLLERRRSRTRRLRYKMVEDGPFRVVEWIPRYDGRDAITGYSKHTAACFGSYEDAEAFIEGDYDEQSAAEARVEIEGPFCVVRLPLFPLTAFHPAPPTSLEIPF